MGFDNESILNPETVPGEYCCPLCRQLVYPTEAQQTLCGHLFCRQCVVYILGTTRCCPYDNHPINEADPKGLREANTSLYESLCRIPVRCIYHKSGCAWQGQLIESNSHSASCPYGSSPVFCNRCGMQIMHRQIQDHVVSCTGTASQSQTQQQTVENSQLAGRAASQQHVLGQGQASAGAQQIQQVSLGSQQIPQVSGHQVPQYVSGQEQPRLQSAAGQWNNQHQQRYQQPHEQYQQYQKHDQPQQIQQLQQHQQQVLTPPTQQFPQAVNPYHSHEPTAQQLQQQMNTNPYLQSQQSIPQGSQAQLPPEQLYMQQQHLHQQAQPQHIPSLQTLQQAQPPWEQQKHQQQMERILDGNVQAHVAAQTRVHDSNAFQHPGLPHSMQQPSTAARSNLPSWQGHTLATASGSRDSQGIQHMSNNQPYSGLSNQYLQAPPTRQASLHSTLNQHLSLPSNQAISLSAQNSELTNTRSFPAAQIASDYLSAPSTYPTQRGALLEQAAYAHQMNLYHQRGGQLRPDKQDGPAPEHRDTKQTVRKPLAVAISERLASVADKQQQKVDDRKVADSFSQRQGRDAPPKDVLKSKTGEDENKQSPSPNKEELHPERQETQHTSEEDDSPKHQSPGASQEDEDEDDPHTLQTQRAHLSNEPSFSPEPMTHTSLEPEDRIHSFPPAQLRNQSHHDTFRPFQSDPVSDQFHHDARMMHLRGMLHEYGRPPIEDGYSKQEAFRDGFFGTPQEGRRPQMRGDFANENSHLQASFAMPPPDGPVRRSFMEASRQAAVGGGSRAERFNWTSTEDNGKRFDDNDKSWLFKSNELDAKDILQNSSFSKFEEPYTQSKIEDISPHRVHTDFLSRYPQNGPILNMRSSMFPFSAEPEGKHGLARDPGADRFLSEIELRQGQSSKLGAWSGTSMDMEPRPRFSAEFGTHVKLHPDGRSRYPPSPDLRMRPGLVEGGAPFGSLSDIDRHPGFPFDEESRPRGPREMEHRPGFPFDMEPQSRFSGDIDSRSVLDLDHERRRAGLPMDARLHPGLPLDMGGHPRLPDLHQDLMERRPEGFSGSRSEGFGGSRSDFTGTISELLRRQPEFKFPPQSPGREHGSLPFRREPGYRLGLPSHLEGNAPRLPFHPGLDVNRDILRREDPRFNIHRHALLHDPGRLIHMGARAVPFGAPGPGMGHLPGHPMLEQLRPGLPPHLLPHGFVNGGPHHQFSQMADSSEALDIGRQATQTGNSGWCRICLVDCFSVDGLRKHSQSEEHQMKTLDLVASIKHDNTKKQKHSADDSRSMPEKHKKARTSSSAAAAAAAAPAAASPSSKPE